MQNQIPNNWQKVKLSDVCYSASEPFDFEKNEKFIFINTADVEEGNFINRNYFNESYLPGQAKKAIKKDDILYSEIRPKNKHFAYVDFDADEYVVSTKLMVIRNKENISPNYLYLLLTNRLTLNNFQTIAESRSGTFPQLTFDAIANYDIMLPQKNEQQSIFKIARSIDDRIELNNKIAKTLEEMAQTLFKEWFVKFKFPEYEKTEFVASELGNIPKGWLADLGNHVEVTDYVANGSFASLRKNVIYNSDKYHAILVRTKDLQENFANELVYIDQNAYEFLKKSKLFGGELILSNVGNVGAIFRCPRLNMPMSLGPNAVVVKNSEYTLYLFLYFKGKVGQSKLRSITGGSSQPKFNKTDFRSLKLIFPSEIVIEKFNEFVEPMYQRIDQAGQENQKLAEYRDLLLPKLMKGEIGV